MVELNSWIGNTSTKVALYTVCREKSTKLPRRKDRLPFFLLILVTEIEIIPMVLVVLMVYNAGDDDGVDKGVFTMFRRYPPWEETPAGSSVEEDTNW